MEKEVPREIQGCIDKCRVSVYRGEGFWWGSLEVL